MTMYYEDETGEEFVTSVDCPERAEMVVDLVEHGGEAVEFFSPKGTLLAKGYLRVLYGDHGPYIEFLKEHLVNEAWSVWRAKSPRAWYDEWKPTDGSDVLLYVQKRSVSMLKNPPRGGRWYVRGNRAEGYADYRPGRFYVSPDVVEWRSEQ